MTAYVNNRKIAIKNLAILQTGDLPAILRYRTIFAPHRIGEHTARCKNYPLPRLTANLPVFPKIKVYFWVFLCQPVKLGLSRSALSWAILADRMVKGCGPVLL